MFTRVWLMCVFTLVTSYVTSNLLTIGSFFGDIWR
jgi:hypothetical protein